MKKIPYIPPTLTEIALAPMQMMAFSGGGDDLFVNPDADLDTELNRARMDDFSGLWQDDLDW